jgi:hypothetical protein
LENAKQKTAGDAGGFLFYLVRFYAIILLEKDLLVCQLFLQIKEKTNAQTKAIR